MVLAEVAAAAGQGVFVELHLGPADAITSHPRIVAPAARACQAPGLPLPHRLPPGGATPILRSGRNRASTPPLIWRSHPAWLPLCLRTTTRWTWVALVTVGYLDGHVTRLLQRACSPARRVAISLIIAILIMASELSVRRS